MVPTPKELEAALIEGTYRIFTIDPDATTVNKVRKHVEEERGLEEGFFTSDDWKQKSKALIKEYVDKLLDGWVPTPKRDSKSENGIKGHASEDESSPPERQNKATKRRNAGAKTKQRRDDAAETRAQPLKTASRRKSKREEPVEEPDEAGNGSDNEPNAAKKESPSEDDALSATKVDTSKTVVKDDEEDEEFSDVIDQGPKPKRKKKDPKPESSSKPSKTPGPKKPSTTTAGGPHEAEIKKLQSQLVKCGVRKLWHNELKQYKDDSRAKIRHLKKMLADIGMDGRFSEAKAREIKEARELLADVHAAQEMNALWGMGGGRRASRAGKHKSVEPDESEESNVEGGPAKNGAKGDDEEADEDEDEDEGTTSFAARRRRAQADLAFLGDESESD